MKNPAYGFAFLAVLLAAACGGSGDDNLPIDPSAGVTSAGSQWTSLGMRRLDSHVNRATAAKAAMDWHDYNPPVIYSGAVREANQPIVMDDGVQLVADIVRPADETGRVVEAPLPVILTLTTYNKDLGGFISDFSGISALGGAEPVFLQHGYVHVNVDVRGTGRSEGTWEAFGEREQQDYNQVIDWIVAQPWCNGKVALHGVSALGITSMLAASKQHPALRAVFAISSMADAYRDAAAIGGQGSYAFLGGWFTLVAASSLLNPRLYESPELYLTTATQHLANALTQFQYPILFNGLMGDPEVVHDGEFWRIRSPVEQAHRIQVPVFLVSGLRDVYQRGKPVLYEALKHQVPTKLLMGPWNHFEAGVGQGLPREGIPTLDYVALQWFDHYLKGEDNGAARLPNVTQWVWGAERYVTVSDWPNPAARARRIYLAGDGRLTEQSPQGEAAPRIVLQQPFNGLCSQSASQVSLGVLSLTQLPCFSDDRLVNALETVYETEPLTEPLYLDGPIQADLWVSTTSQDSGLVVRVSDVASDGSAFNLSNGMLQLSHRSVDPGRSRYLDGEMIQPWHPFTGEAKEAVDSGEILSAAVEVWPVSAVIQSGHRLRISVGSSNFPYGLSPLPELPLSALGVLSVYGDADHPSSVVLPVVPASNLEPEE